MRTLPGAVAALIDDAQAMEFHLLEFDFSGGVLYLTTSAVTISWNGHVWTAVGGALSFGGVEETSDSKAQGVELKMSGVEQSIIALLLTQNYRGRKVKIRRVWLVNGAVVDDPYQTFEGFMNERWQMEEVPGQGSDPSTCTITTRVISRLAEMGWARGIRSNVTSHQRYFPTDTFFSQTSAIQGRRLKWPVS